MSPIHSGARISIFTSTFFAAVLPFELQAQTYVTPVEETGGAELILEDDSSITVSVAIPNSAVALQATNPGSRITAKNISINTVNAVGVGVENGGRVDLIGGGELNTTGTFSSAVTAAGAGSEINITGSSAANRFRINTNDSSVGLMVSDDAHINLDNVSLSVHDDGLYGVLAYSTTGKAYLTASNSVFTMASRDSVALRADYNAVMNVSDSQIISSESVGVGIYAMHGAEVNLTGNSSITTSGPAGVGVLVSAQGSDPTVVNLIAGAGKQIQISTAGFSGYGVYAQGAESYASLDGASISTSGPSAPAVRVDSGAKVTLNQGRIITSGADSFGLHAKGSGSLIDARNMDISTSGASSNGILLQEGGRVSLGGSVLQASGVEAVGAYIDAGSNVLTLSGSQLSSAQSYGIYSRSGDTEINLAASTITGGTGAIYADASASTGETVLLAVSQGSTVDGNIYAARELSGSFSDSVLNGNVEALSSSTLNDNVVLDFTDGSRMVGSASGISRAGFADSTWVMTDSSTITGLSSSGGGLSLSNGQVIFAAQGTTYKVLTASALSGSGVFELNTSLNQGGGSTQSDLVHITGNASGSYQLGINNTDGVGAKTQGDGIRVVQLDGASNSASFGLRRPVVAGAYEYFLYQGGAADADDWYLRSDLMASTPSTEPDSNPPTAYNPSVAGYAVGAHINRQYGFDSIGTLYQRVGDQMVSGDKAGINQTSWIRVAGGEQKLQPGRFKYDADTWFAQFGSDLYQSINADGSRTHAGVMATLGQTNVGAGDSLRSQRPGLSDHTGSMTAKAYGAGAYFTHYLEDASYLDVVGQFNHYSNDYSSIYGSTASQNANGVTLSVEAGKPFKHDSGWYVEPQIQVMYQHLRSSDLNDGTVDVKGVKDSSGLVRLGARVGYGDDASSRARPYLTVNVLSNIGDAPEVDVDGVKIRNDYSQRWAEVGGGITGQVAENISIYADLHYQRAFDGDMHGIGGSFGVRMGW